MPARESILITGAGKGLGRVLAELALAQGFSVAALARSRQDLLALKKAHPGNFLTAHVVDLTDSRALKKEFPRIRKAHPRIRVLVNNAGTWTGGKRIQDLSKKDVQLSLEQNFFSAFSVTQEVLSQRRRSGARRPLSVVFIGATASLQGWPSVGAFCIGKGAMRTFAQSLAREMGPDGVHVSHLVIDGLLDNERTRHLNPRLGSERFMKQNEVAKSILHVALQDRSCWTFEWDLRPFNENW